MKPKVLIVDDSATDSRRTTSERKRGKRDAAPLDRSRDTVDDLTDRPI